jgi:hypothetical protein
MGSNQCGLVLVAFALSIAGELNGAAERVENVLVGGAIGLALVVSAHESAKLVSRRTGICQSIPLKP